MNARPRWAVAVSAAGVRAPVPARTVRALRDAVRAVLKAESVRDAMISVALVSNARIAALNSRHLDRSGPTDVIAFGLARTNRGPVVGDLYLAPGVARTNARRHGVTQREEMLRIVVHGVLHVLGHDHPEGEARTRSAMWKRQEAIVSRMLRSGAR